MNQRLLKEARDSIENIYDLGTVYMALLHKTGTSRFRKAIRIPKETKYDLSIVSVESKEFDVYSSVKFYELYTDTQNQIVYMFCDHKKYEWANMTAQQVKCIDCDYKRFPTKEDYRKIPMPKGK